MSWGVLYIHPAKQEVGFRYDEYVSSPPYLLMPVGVIGLANLLCQRGLEVRGLNLPLELILEPTFDLRAWLKRWDPPRLVMIDLHWYEHALRLLLHQSAGREERDFQPYNRAGSKNRSPLSRRASTYAQYVSYC